MTTKSKHRKISVESWGNYQGREIMLFKIINENGAFVTITNFGATLVTVIVPDRNGRMDNVVLTYPDLNGYIDDRAYIGSTIGRFANRIGNAAFTLDGRTHHLDKNDGRNTNHGGDHGFHKRIFDYRIEDGKIIFSLFSNDGDGGYPGNVNLSVAYSWSDSHELLIEYSASTDQKTVLNFTNHAYFNLSAAGNIFNHKLTIASEKVLESDGDYIPTGVILHAGDKVFSGEPVKNKFLRSENQIVGLNTYYILSDNHKALHDAACILYDELSGRKMKVFTTYPGVQLYTGDFLSGTMHKPFDGLCLECQYYPDSPNHANFSNTVLEAGEKYDEKIVYKFSVDDSI